MKGAFLVPLLVAGCSSSGRIANDVSAVESSIPYLASDYPVSVGVTTRDGIITVTLMNVLGGSSSCDVVKMGIDGVAYGAAITLTFPIGVQSGQYALTDIGATASFRINDGACAPAHTDVMTNGVVTFAETNSVSWMKLQFTMGIVIAGPIAAPLCGVTGEAAGDAGACAVLPPCLDSGSLSCFQMTGQ